jgi:hypothetical protein
MTKKAKVPPQKNVVLRNWSTHRRASEFESFYSSKKILLEKNGIVKPLLISQAKSVSKLNNAKVYQNSSL